MATTLDDGASGRPPARGAPPVSLVSALSASAAPPAATPPGAGRIGAWRYGLHTGLLTMVAIVLLPGLLGTAWTLGHLRELALRDAFGQADLMTSRTAESLRWLMQDAQAMMGAVADRPKVQALNGEDCDPVFTEYRSLSPAFKALSLRRLDGSSVCSELLQPPSRATVAAAAWFTAAVRHNAFQVSDAHVGAVAQVWTARLTHPVVGPDGKTGGLLVAPVDLLQLQQRLFANMPDHAVVAVVDGSNRVVVRSQLQDLRVGKPAAEGVARAIDDMRRSRAADPNAPAVRQFTEVGISGARSLFVIRSVPMSNWTVVGALPEQQTLQGYQDWRNRALTAIAAILAVVALAVWRVGRGILLPMQGLARAARGVARGETRLRAPESGPREVVEVAREFNRMVADTTEAAERLRASEHHYRTLIQHLPVAVVSHRPDSSIEVFNDRACALLRMTPEQMQGRKALDRAWHFVDPQGQRMRVEDYPVSRVLRTRQAMPSEVLGIVSEDPSCEPGPGGAPQVHTWVMVAGYPQFEGAPSPGRPGGEDGLTRAIIVFVDVTAQRHTEELRVAKEAAEAASKAKSVFLSRVSHELRTPLNAIIGFSELMLMDAQTPPPARGKVQHVLNAGRHLLSLINQILDLTRVESGQMHTAVQPVRLGPLLEECLAICGPLAQAKGVALVLEPPAGGLAPAEVGVMADATNLRQVLMNLLSNGVKYNRHDLAAPRVAVRVEAVAMAEGPPDIVVTVADTGPGLSAQQLAGLFQPFSRLGAETSGIEGHGLGLVISRLLAQSMGGELTVHSVEGEGSRFVLRLHGAAASKG